VNANELARLAGREGSQNEVLTFLPVEIGCKGNNKFLNDQTFHRYFFVRSTLP
jgi:hypothetical protein